MKKYAKYYNYHCISIYLNKCTSKISFSYKKSNK